MPCYDLPEFIPIGFRDLSPEMQERILEVIPDINKEKTLFCVEFELPPMEDDEEDDICYNKPPFLGVVPSDSMISDLYQAYRLMVNDNRNGYIYACYDYEGFSSYDLFAFSHNSLIYFNAWQNEDGTLRFNEVADGPIQYISTLYNNVEKMSVSEMHDYILKQYELWGYGEDSYIEVYDSNEDPTEFIQKFETDIPETLSF